MQTKEELLEIEQRLLVEMGRRYGAHLEKAAAARRARSRERARRAREAAIQGIRTAGGDGGGGQAPQALLRPADGRHNGVRAKPDRAEKAENINERRCRGCFGTRSPFR